MSFPLCYRITCEPVSGSYAQDTKLMMMMMKIDLLPHGFLHTICCSGAAKCYFCFRDIRIQTFNYHSKF